MIAIFSSIDDKSTNHIIDWLRYWNKQFIRVNDNFTSTDKDDRDLTIHINKQGNSISLSGRNMFDISSIYYRRPRNNNLDFYYPTTVENNNGKLEKEINSKLSSYSQILKEYIIRMIDSNAKTIIGYYHRTKLNKLVVLSIAKKIGLSIPNTIVTDSVKEVCDFFYKNNQLIISKPIEEMFYCSEADYYYNNSVLLINSVSQIRLRRIDCSLFQEYIDKKYELRIFYIHRELYTIAIFSQNNPKTKVDFRNYDTAYPNKIVPYNLPEVICERIRILMDALNLNTGSIDMLVKSDNEYVFLEINPIGQYGFISKYCNADLNYVIAKILSDEESVAI